MAIRRITSSGTEAIGLVFNATDGNDFNYMEISHRNDQFAPRLMWVEDGRQMVQITPTIRSSAAMPALTSSSVLWARVTNDGTKVTVKCLEGSSAPSEGAWSAAAVAFEADSFSNRGGMLGFATYQGRLSVDDLTIRSWNSSGSAFDIIEQVERFTVDGSGYAVETLTHDPAGNLTYDGVHAFAYDAWNRLVTVRKAYRDGGSVQSGQVFVAMRYDGRGRRIVKAVTNTGHLDATYHYYYDGESMIETR